MASITTITFFFLAFSLLTTTSILAAAANSSPFSKIYAFGDSFTDTGNTRSSSGPFAFGHVSNPPYGATFFHHPTNRYSDGRLVVDFLAATLSLPFLPPYLNRTADFSHGVNFAVAGSTALSHEFFVKNNISLDITPQSLGTQLQWFNSYLEEKGCKTARSPQCRALMDDALFWVGEIGVNDFAYTIASSLPPETIRALAINNVSAFLKALLEKGAKYVVVQGLPLAGCLPLTITLAAPSDKDDVGCSTTANDASRAYNTLLQAQLQELRKQFPHSIISYADYLGAHHTVMKNPSTYGFTEPFKTCCGSGGGSYNFDMFTTCGSPGAPPACAEPAKYVNWDGVHLTEATYKTISDMFFNRDFCHPSFRLLVSRKEQQT